MFEKLNDGDYTVARQEPPKIKDLPANVYNPHILETMMGDMIIYEKDESLEEKLIPFETPVIKQVVSYVDEFLSKRTKELYRAMGISHKLGVLLYGPQGTGKTCLMRLISEQLQDKYQALTFIINSVNLSDIATLIKTARKESETQQNVPIVLIMDEAEFYVKNYENQLLQFLDGRESLEGVIMLAATNYLEAIPARIKDRPSRFKFVLEVKSLPYEMYFNYAKDKELAVKKFKVPAFAEKLAKKGEGAGLTMDEYKHMVIDYVVSGGTSDITQNQYKDEEDATQGKSMYTPFGAATLKSAKKALNIE